MPDGLGMRFPKRQRNDVALIALGVLGMPRYHTVRQGECLWRIAHRYGFRDYQTIYDHPQNANFKRRRPNPSIIYPGDRIYIPDKQERQESRGTTQRHRFRTPRPDVILRLRLIQDTVSGEAYDDRVRPFANQPYRLRVASQTLEGTTTGEGIIEQRIPIDAEEAELTLFPDAGGPQTGGCVFTLRIGYLDPADEIEGVAARLNNLGFFAGPQVKSQIDEEFRQALQRAQASAKIDVTGDADAATKTKLEELHGD